MKSTGQKILQLQGLVGTQDITEWEDAFIKSVDRNTDGGKITAALSEKQVAIVERIWGKHFA